MDFLTDKHRCLQHNHVLQLSAKFGPKARLLQRKSAAAISNPSMLNCSYIISYRSP